MTPDRPTPSPRQWPVHRTFYTSYHDTDVLNHLNHAAYFPWMETLRCDYYLALTGTQDPRNLDIIIAEATCRYLAPVPYGAEILGEVAPARPLGRTSFSLLYRFRAGKPSSDVAKGRTVVVCYDYRTSSKKAISPVLRAALERDSIDATAEGWS